MGQVEQLTFPQLSVGRAPLFVNPRTGRFHRLDRIHAECHLDVVARGGAGYFVDSDAVAVTFGLQPCGRCVPPLAEAA